MSFQVAPLLPEGGVSSLQKPPQGPCAVHQLSPCPLARGGLRLACVSRRQKAALCGKGVAKAPCAVDREELHQPSLCTAKINGLTKKINLDQISLQPLVTFLMKQDPASQNLGSWEDSKMCKMYPPFCKNGSLLLHPLLSCCIPWHCLGTKATANGDSWACTRGILKWNCYSGLLPQGQENHSHHFSFWTTVAQQMFLRTPKSIRLKTTSSSSRVVRKKQTF